MGNWFVTAKRADFQKIAQEFGISPVLARLIRNRDVCGEEEIRRYLHGGMADLYDPWLLKGMDRAVAVIRKAIEEKKKIRPHLRLPRLREQHGYPRRLRDARRYGA